MLSTQDEKNKKNKIATVLSKAIKSPSISSEEKDTESFIRMFSGVKAKLSPDNIYKLMSVSFKLSNYAVFNHIIENVDITLFNNAYKDLLSGFLYLEMLKSSPDIKTMRGLVNRFDIDPNLKVRSSGDAVLFLSLEKCPEFAEDLIEKGARLDIVIKSDFTKMTPLMSASGKGYAELVNIMILHGANVNAVDDKGYSSLHIAIMNKKYVNDYEKKEKLDEIIQALVKNKANLFFSATIRGFTPFMEATINSDIKTLQVLIDHVPAEQKYDMLNGKSRSNGGITPLMMAINMEQLETAEFLINQEGIDVRVLADNDQDTALTELIFLICDNDQSVENQNYTKAIDLLKNVVILLGPISKHQKSKLVKLAEQSGENPELVTILRESIIVQKKQKKFKTQSIPGASALDDSTEVDDLQPGVKEKKEYLDSLSKYDASLYEEHKDKLEDGSIEQIESFFWQKLQQNLLNTDEQIIYNAALSNSATRETREIIYQELNDMRNEQIHRGTQFLNLTKISLSPEFSYTKVQPNNKSYQITMDDADIEIGMRRYYRGTEKPKRNLPANFTETKNDLILMKQDLHQLLTHDKTENFSSKIVSRNKLVSKSFKHDTNDMLSWKKELDKNKKLKSILDRQEKGRKAKPSFTSKVIGSNSARCAMQK